METIPLGAQLLHASRRRHKETWRS